MLYAIYAICRQRHQAVINDDYCFNKDKYSKLLPIYTFAKPYIYIYLHKRIVVMLLKQN